MTDINKLVRQQIFFYHRVGTGLEFDLVTPRPLLLQLLPQKNSVSLLLAMTLCVSLRQNIRDIMGVANLVILYTHSCKAEVERNKLT